MSRLSPPIALVPPIAALVVALGAWAACVPSGRDSLAAVREVSEHPAKLAATEPHAVDAVPVLGPAVSAPRTPVENDSRSGRVRPRAAGQSAPADALADSRPSGSVDSRAHAVQRTRLGFAAALAAAMAGIDASRSTAPPPSLPG